MTSKSQLLFFSKFRVSFLVVTYSESVKNFSKEYFPANSCALSPTHQFMLTSFIQFTSLQLNLPVKFIFIHLLIMYIKLHIRVIALCIFLYFKYFNIYILYDLWSQGTYQLNDEEEPVFFVCLPWLLYTIVFRNRIHYIINYMYENMWSSSPYFNFLPNSINGA